MKLYYQNETLFVDLTMSLDDEKISCLKHRIFRIVDDYEIDHIILRSFSNNFEYKRKLEKIKKEYYKKYSGQFLIK